LSKAVSPIVRFFRELHRRRVFRTAALYIVSTWLVLQVGDVIFPALDISERAIRYVLIGAVAAFPVVLVFGWFYDIGADGIRRTSRAGPEDLGEPQPLRRIDYLLLTALLGVAGTILYNVAGNVIDESSPVQAREGGGPPMVAVLPFTAASLDGENEFFAYGVHDDLLTQLAQLESIRVISRTSVLEYKDTIRNIREIGATLGADAILEGGVQSAGDRIRINAQLIDARTDEHLWAQTYDRELNATNIFEVQSEIARAIMSAMHATLTPQDENQLTIIPTENMAAYRAYRSAMDMAESTGVWRNAEYRAALEKAVALDPGFTRALAELAGHLAYINNWGEPVAEEVERSEQLLEKLRMLAPDSADHLIAQAYYSLYILKEYDQSFEIISRAERKAPSDLKILNMKTWILRRQGRHEERQDVFLKILNLDPRNEGTSWAMVYNLLVTHQYEKAWQELENAPFEGRGHTDLRSLRRLAKHGDFELYMSELINLYSEYESEISPWQVWESLIWARDFRAAEQRLESLIRTDLEPLPGLGGYRAAKILTYRFLNEDVLFQQAMKEVGEHFDASETRETAQDEPGLILDLALYEGFLGKKEEAIRLVRLWHRTAVKDATQYSTQWSISCQILGMVGAAPEAVECIRSGLVQPSYVFPFLEPHLPFYDPIRQSPEFRALLTELGSGQ
jgi:TolB-like protein